ncbi:hypothetical protein R6Q57_018262 [Mikania cordata]
MASVESLWPGWSCWSLFKKNFHASLFFLVSPNPIPSHPLAFAFKDVWLTSSDGNELLSSFHRPNYSDFPRKCRKYCTSS